MRGGGVMKGMDGDRCDGVRVGLEDGERWVRVRVANWDRCGGGAGGS